MFVSDTRTRHFRNSSTPSFATASTLIHGMFRLLMAGANPYAPSTSLQRSHRVQPNIACRFRKGKHSIPCPATASNVPAPGSVFAFSHATYHLHPQKPVYEDQLPQSSIPPASNNRIGRNRRQTPAAIVDLGNQCRTGRNQKDRIAYPGGTTHPIIPVCCSVAQTRRLTISR
ncbi:MAG: hypothetical protein RLZZ232_2237 [Planctomycetota bacterium]